MMLMAKDGVDLSSFGGEDLGFGGGLEVNDLLIDLDSLMTTMEDCGPPPPQHPDVLTSQDKLTDAPKVFLTDHKHFSGKHTMDLDQDAPVNPKKKLSEQFLGDLSTYVPSATRRKIITHLEEELTDANERVVLLLARKKKITKLLMALRYPEEEEDVDSAGEEESEKPDY